MNQFIAERITNLSLMLPHRRRHFAGEYRGEQQQTRCLGAVAGYGGPNGRGAVEQESSGC